MLDETNVVARRALFDTSNNMPDVKPPVYRALMALKPDGVALGRWATDAGLARNYFNGLEKHGNPSEDVISKLLAAISTPRRDYERALEHARLTQDDFVMSEVAGVAAGRQDVRREFYGDEAAPLLPLLGTALGGDFPDNHEHIELYELHQSEVLDYLNRPASLNRDPHAYAVEIVGDSMVPRFKPRERVAVSPRASVGIGDDVIVQLRGTSEESADRVVLVLIKELVKRAGDHIMLRQFNPDITFRVDMSRVAALHKVKGNFF